MPQAGEKARKRRKTQRCQSLARKVLPCSRVCWREVQCAPRHGQLVAQQLSALAPRRGSRRACRTQAALLRISAAALLLTVAAPQGMGTSRPLAEDVISPLGEATPTSSSFPAAASTSARAAANMAQAQVDPQTLGILRMCSHLKLAA